jgi:hypothetical protein
MPVYHIPHKSHNHSQQHNKAETYQRIHHTFSQLPHSLNTLHNTFTAFTLTPFESSGLKHLITILVDWQHCMESSTPPVAWNKIATIEWFQQF